MPQLPKESSTSRRKRLADYIELHGHARSHSCSNCARRNRTCYTHTRSARCGECNRHGLTNCDIHISRSIWDSLQSQRQTLVAQITEARKATEFAFAREREARDMATAAWMTEARLQQRLSALDERAGEAIAAEEASLLEQESSNDSSSDQPLDLDHNQTSSLGSNVDLSLLSTEWESLRGTNINHFLFNSAAANVDHGTMNYGGQNADQF